MNNFFSIYSRLNRSLLSEAALSVDSNRDVTSRGNSHNDKTLTDPNTRDKILTARIQEIEAFAKDRGIEPLIAMGASEAALRTGRIPNLAMYGLHGDNMVALKHFIAGEILNLAGMEAINWDGTPIEEADATPPSHHAIATRLSGVVERHFLKNLNGVKNEEAGAFHRFRTKLQKHIKSLLKGGKHDTSDPYWHQLHIALAANQNEVLLKDVPESIHHFINSDKKQKSDQGKPEERWGVPKEEDDPNDMKRKGGKVGGPPTRGKFRTDDIEINGQLQQEYAADRGGSAVSNLNNSSTSAKPVEVGKKRIQGDFNKTTLATIKKGQANVQKGERTGEKGDKKMPMKPTDLSGLSGGDVAKLGRELGAMDTGQTGESVEIKNKDLLNIEPGDFRNETWPKMSGDLRRLLDLDKQPQTHGIGETETPKKSLPPKPRREPPPKRSCQYCGHEGRWSGRSCPQCGPEEDEQEEGVAIRNKDLLNIESGDFRNETWPKMSNDLKRLLNVESRGLYFGDQNATPVDESAGTKFHKAGRSTKFKPVARGGMTGRDVNVANKLYGALPFEHRHNGSRRLIDQMLNGEKMEPATTDERAAVSHIKQAALAHLDSVGVKVSDIDGANLAETTTSGVVGPFMSLGNQMVGRPNQIASWDASVDLNGFQPARLGMITPDPVFPVDEARRYRDAEAAAEFIASKKLNTKFNDSAFALHKGRDGSIHVQIRGAAGKDGTHPSDDPGNEDEEFTELTRGERGKFLAQPSEVKERGRTAATGVPGVGKTVEPTTKRHSAMQTLQAALSSIRGAAR